VKIIFNKIFLEHDTGMHPENRKRLEALGDLEETKIEDGEKYLSLFHKKDYIKRVKILAESGGGYLDPDTIISKRSYEAALYAVGATIMASKTNNFALVRPPGHHAHPSRSSGFCVFNNISIAVQKLLEYHKKILILDFDSHLGDGTSRFFYKSNRVLYWSLHQFPAFPGNGTIEEIGEEEGKGYNINIPLPPGTGDDVYMKALIKFLPIAKKFNPDIVAVSAGFDGHKDDLLLNLNLSMNIYYKIGEILRKNFDNIFATLEGGYNVKTFPSCLYNFIDGINNEKQKFKEKKTKTDIQKKKRIKEKMNELEEKISKFW